MIPKKIITVVGARPQFIKASAVSRAFNRWNENRQASIEEKIVHTGQHFDRNMSQVFFDQLQIPRPTWNLGISNLDHGAMTGRMLEGIEAIMKDERPDWILVYGDTNSTLAGALAATKQKLKIAHVEAGLRSFNRHMPEEINRLVTDQLSTLLFCPTEAATINLSEEGFPHRIDTGNKQEVINVGDVMFDSALHFARIAETKSTIMTRLRLEGEKYILATIHRAENTDDLRRLTGIVDALNDIARNFRVVVPLHPRTRKMIEVSEGTVSVSQKVQLVDPMSYLDMVLLERNAALIVTDSGGVQKEAFFFGVPCITVRDETEWVELVDLGWNSLASPTDPDFGGKILSAIGTNGIPARPYGDGMASQKIIECLW